VKITHAIRAWWEVGKQEAKGTFPYPKPHVSIQTELESPTTRVGSEEQVEMSYNVADGRYVA
jgi:hypothetical protein